MDKQEISLDIRAALIAQQNALDDDKRIKCDVLTILKYENNTVRVARRLGVHRARLYEWVKGQWLPRDILIRELIKQWAQGIRDLQKQSPSQS